MKGLHKYTFVNQAEYRYFALQLAPKIPVHEAGSLVNHSNSWGHCPSYAE